MKFSTIFSAVGFAATAFAAPLLDGTLGGAAGTVGGATGTASGLVGTVQAIAGSVVDVKDVTGSVAKVAKRDITDAAGLLDTLNNSGAGVSKITVTLQSIADQVKSGDLSKKDGLTKGQDELQKLEVVLTKLVKQLSGSTGINIQKTQLVEVTTTVNTLVAEVLVTVNNLVTVLGLTPVLTSIVQSVIGLVTKVLILVIGLVAAIVPGVVAGLVPVLSGVSTGLLLPLLTPIAALLAGLAA